eukprot:251129-Pleurochrysis_carterae.AAC.1
MAPASLVGRLTSRNGAHWRRATSTAYATYSPHACARSRCARECRRWPRFWVRHPRWPRSSPLPTNSC